MEFGNSSKVNKIQEVSVVGGGIVDAIRYKGFGDNARKDNS